MMHSRCGRRTCSLQVLEAVLSATQGEAVYEPLPSRVLLTDHGDVATMLKGES